MPSQPTLSGPSHRYDLYPQQTGIPQGAMANTLAVNQSNAHISQYGYSEGYLSGISPSEEFVDFGSAPAQTPYNRSDMDMEYSSPNDPTYFYDQSMASSSEFVNPSAIGSSHLPVANVLPTQTSNVGRLWPGMHQQQAALAKAQAQQKQQQQIIQQQRQNAMGQQPRQAQRPKAAHGPADPIVEEKISQLLNSMRQSSVATDGGDADTPNGNMSNAHRMRKEEEDMDEDERLLASEEGKKLSSKERRQLRNKVSARAFRSRRKEYISQLEGEIAGKVNENSDLRSQNRALMEENTRLSDLTRMLLSSPSFSGFLDTLTANPAAQQQLQQQQQSAQQAPQVQEQPRQIRKDVNPYTAQQQMQQQQIGMAMIPEQHMDFSMLDLNTDGQYSYQPQVFSVLSLPETVIDASVLSGKTSNTVTFASDDEKVEIPIVKRPVSEVASVEAPVVVDEEFESDPAFALFAESSAPVSTETPAGLEFPNIQIFAGIECEKASQYSLVVADEASSSLALSRAMRRAESMEATFARLELLTLDF
jgi:hypothetical protein